MNETIKRRIKESRIRQYEIATNLGISEFTLSRWFRTPLTKEKQELILSAIDTIRREENYGTDKD